MLFFFLELFQNYRHTDASSRSLAKGWYHGYFTASVKKIPDDNILNMQNKKDFARSKKQLKRPTEEDCFTFETINNPKLELVPPIVSKGISINDQTSNRQPNSERTCTPIPTDISKPGNSGKSAANRNYNKNNSQSNTRSPITPDFSYASMSGMLHQLV